MADKPVPPGRTAVGTGADDRGARLEAAMRVNLQRRKHQQRAREALAPASGDAAEPVEPGWPIP